MDTRSLLLVETGYRVLSLAGNYCLAMREDAEVILRWDGEKWLLL